MRAADRLAALSGAHSLTLAGAGDTDRAETRPRLVLAFAGKVTLDATSAGFFAVEQVSRHRKICSWCLASAALTFAMVPQVVPETRRALGGLAPPVSAPRPRVVVVTGGSAGVGRATALAFAEAGYDVAVLARGEDRLASTRRQIEASGQRALCIPCDVADADAVERAAADIEEALGPIDVWVNNAMLTVFSRVDDIRPDEFRRVTEVTYLGVVHGTMAALRRMRPRDHGTIIQVGSALSHRSIPLQSAYCGAKHAIVGFTASLRCELAHDKSNIHVGMVQLPAMNTPNKFIPGSLDRYLGRIAYDAQHTDHPAPAGRVDNLADAAPGTQGAHGPFDDGAKTRSLETLISRHRNAFAAVTAAAVPLVALAGRRWLG